MIPLTTSSPTLTTPPPVVHTPTAPASNGPVAATAVAPSFSTAPADNNARGNNVTASAQEALPAAPSSAAARAASPPAIAAASATLGSSANFLAQLIGQDLSPSAQSVLVEYEKLVYLSTVKYKPSDAQKPQAQPSDLFSRIVSENKSAEATATTAASLLAATSNETESTAVTINAQASGVPILARNARPTAAQEAQAEEDALAAIINSTPVPAQATSPAVFNAYLSTASRVNSQAINSVPGELA